MRVESRSAGFFAPARQQQRTFSHQKAQHEEHITLFNTPQEQQQQAQRQQQQQRQQQPQVISNAADFKEVLTGRVAVVAGGVQRQNIENLKKVLSSPNPLNELFKFGHLSHRNQITNNFINYTFYYFCQIVHSKIESTSPSTASSYFINQVCTRKQLNDYSRRGRVLAEMVNKLGLVSWLATELYILTDLISCRGDDYMDALHNTQINEFPNLHEFFTTTDISLINVLKDEDAIVRKICQHHQQQKASTSQQQQQQAPTTFPSRQVSSNH